MNAAKSLTNGTETVKGEGMADTTVSSYVDEEGKVTFPDLDLSVAELVHVYSFFY